MALSFYQILTPREREVYTVLANGMRYKQISASLEISIDTVKKHIKNIYKKLKVSNRYQALAKMRQHHQMSSKPLLSNYFVNHNNQLYESGIVEINNLIV
jgi:DNA-binding CsgD family transcriptional regulator